ncbi:hypothetical protein [Parasitella parasitica]|uniref:Uncharacterized protein n=1 Tax=Parasitella parasitica TaxID=35722 RepID=A0A0B7NQL0_9FUNG|nr:hypothetical protein [Parasitella parasitica]
MPPISNILNADNKDEMVSIKKAKTTAEAITRLYGIQSSSDHESSSNSTTSSQFKMIEGVLNSINLKAYTMFPNTKDECYSISTDVQLPRIMMACEERGINVVPCVSSENNNNIDNTTKTEVNNDYIQYLISTNKINTTPLLTDKYTEITENQLELLNEDWNFGFHLRAVSAQLLAGCLLVEKNEVLLVNCIELYSRSKHQDIHSERFDSASSNSSAPIGDELYETIKISNIDRDNSHNKLIIGSKIFSGLVTSSLRLDSENQKPELGPSTYFFHPTSTTKLFVSSSSIKRANALLAKKSTQINNFDKFAQLRQLRSNFTIPTTYCFSRCSSRFTDNVHMRPYTIFTAFCAEEGDEFSDVKLGSSIMRFMATVMFNQERTFSCKQFALIAPPLEKKTYVYLQYKKILELGSVNDTITIFGNLALENILFGIAEKITPPLKELNNKASKKILQRMK